MTFTQSISACMGKYATFRGRATKSEYWWFTLFVILMSWGADIVASVSLATGNPVAVILPLIVQLVFSFHLYLLDLEGCMTSVRVDGGSL